MFDTIRGYIFLMKNRGKKLLFFQNCVKINSHKSRIYWICITQCLCNFLLTHWAGTTSLTRGVSPGLEPAPRVWLVVKFFFLYSHFAVVQCTLDYPNVNYLFCGLSVLKNNMFFFVINKLTTKSRKNNYLFA